LFEIDAGVTAIALVLMGKTRIGVVGTAGGILITVVNAVKLPITLPAFRNAQLAIIASRFPWRTGRGRAVLLLIYPIRTILVPVANPGLRDAPLARGDLNATLEKVLVASPVGRFFRKRMPKK
jgi:hypothetical protein